jgi:UDP-N-acetylglucosamine 1-carboxyvinyltransferase
MDYFLIDGGARLTGSVAIGGAKNAALPIMAATILTEGETVLCGVPDLADVNHLMQLLQQLGVCCRREADGSLCLRVEDDSQCHAEYDLVRKMRASVCVMGPLLARRRRAQVSMPGGCTIGYRPIDLHLKGMRSLGADVQLIGGDVHLRADRLRGAEVFLGGSFGSTVTGTANVMMAAVLAKGTTVVESAACEPEIADLAEFLNACGARIRGHGSPKIVIEGVERLTGCRYTVIPDRIEAGTFMMAAAITGGELTLANGRMDHLLAVVEVLRHCSVSVERDGDDVVVAAGRELMPATVATQPYPGYPTDLQAQLMALLSRAAGNSVITEKIFPDRFLHVAELNRMGARLRKEGATVIVEGVAQLIGAPVMASDLRASAAMVLAGLAAKGQTRVSRVYHIDRGYEGIETKLAAVGAAIRRLSE